MFAPLRRLGRRHPIGTIVVVLFLFGLLAWQFRSTILRTGADLWAVSDRIDAPADAVIVLGGQFGLRPRTRAAADLYRRGLTPKVLISNPDYSTVSVSERQRTDAEINKALLRNLGIPDSAMFVFGNGLADTYAEVRAVLAWAKDARARRIIVPVEWYFSRRAGWIFRRELGRAGVGVQILSLDSIEPSRSDWWRTSEGIQLFRTEVLKYLYYRLKY